MTTILYIPIGFDLETKIVPFVGSTLIRSEFAERSCPFKLFFPEYEKVPDAKHYAVKEKGVISKY
jgi:hypothetical protein